MTLSAGTRLGNYEIVEPLGSGGMGEVYRARDLRLGRSVAIKALPEDLAHDAERVARFEREARALASVQHANIAVLYGIEDRDGASYLAIELVDGQTLAQRLIQGALGVEETLHIGAQIAAALDAAHAQGIVHRDLKPGNVMVTASGMVKVLDFGLAKTGPAMGDSASELSASPTVAFGSTAAGVVVGTAAYMSPEQARGKAVDRRTDVWALGCVLYECLSGRPVFSGETTSDVLARVLEREPDWAALPAATPTRLRDLLRRCLTKKPAERPRDAGDLRGELLAIAADRSSPGASAPAEAPPSLAVLYFENLSTDGDSDYFCAGVTEDILTDLSKIRGMRVASRAAVARYRDAPADVARVASDLGVGAVLEGSVRRSGPRVRITVQLSSADGFQLWGERFDRTLDDVFAVQEEIASAIVTALKVALTPAEKERIGQDRPAAAHAYDLYLKGREHYRRFVPESEHEAIRLFEQALEVDPNYALAYAGIADACGQLLQWSDEDAGELIRRGLEAARRAIALNPRLAEAHKAEGLVLGYAGDPKGSVAALHRAIEADPRYPPGLGNLASERFRNANLAAAERLNRRAIELVPDDPHYYIWAGLITMYTNRLEEAAAHNDRVLELSSAPFYVNHACMLHARLALLRGSPADARHWMEEARRRGGDAAHIGMLEANLAALAGDSDRVTSLLAEFGSETSLSWPAIQLGADAAFRVDRPDQALALMRLRSFQPVAHVLLRLDRLLHPLLDLEAFAPRRSPLTLVWPVEAPMIDRTRLRLFKEVRIGSGTPEGSDILMDE